MVQASCLHIVVQACCLLIVCATCHMGDLWCRHPACLLWCRHVACLLLGILPARDERPRNPERPGRILPKLRADALPKAVESRYQESARPEGASATFSVCVTTCFLTAKRLQGIAQGQRALKGALPGVSAP